MASVFPAHEVAFDPKDAYSLPSELFLKSATLGGVPYFPQRYEEPQCPHCRRPMSFLGRFSESGALGCPALDLQGGWGLYTFVCGRQRCDGGFGITRIQR